MKIKKKYKRYFREHQIRSLSDVAQKVVDLKAVHAQKGLSEQELNMMMGMIHLLVNQREELEFFFNSADIDIITSPVSKRSLTDRTQELLKEADDYQKIHGRIHHESETDRPSEPFDRAIEKMNIRKEDVIGDGIFNGTCVSKGCPHFDFGKKEKGVKYNQHKLPLDIVISRQFPNALQAIALSSSYGHSKYAETDVNWDNFKKEPNSSASYADALQRHNIDKSGTDESGLPHIFMKAWNAMAECEMWVIENNFNIADFSKKYLKTL